VFDAYNRVYLLMSESDVLTAIYDKKCNGITGAQNVKFVFLLLIYTACGEFYSTMLQLKQLIVALEA